MSVRFRPSAPHGSFRRCLPTSNRPACRGFLCPLPSVHSPIAAGIRYRRTPANDPGSRRNIPVHRTGDHFFPIRSIINGLVSIDGWHWDDLKTVTANGFRPVPHDTAMTEPGGILSHRHRAGRQAPRHLPVLSDLAVAIAPHSRIRTGRHDGPNPTRPDTLCRITAPDRFCAPFHHPSGMFGA